MSDVLSLLFQSALAIEGILFAAFGIFFSVYALFFSLVNLENPQAPPVVNQLRNVCRGLAILILINAIIAIYSLIRINLLNFKLDYSGIENIVLSILFAVTIVALVVISYIWAFYNMPQ